MASLVSTLVRDVGAWLYPPICIACKSPKEIPGTDFCRTCAESLTALASTASCPRCAAPSPESAACPFCRGAGMYPFESIVTLGPFRQPLRKMVHQMKYRHRWPLAVALADRLAAERRAMDLLNRCDILIPTPLHWSRHIQRGYNQADMIAGQLARHRRGLRLLRPLVRLKKTAAQTTVVSAADRAANLRFAFGLTSTKGLQGKTIALVDDVLTTASTLKSAARALQDANPAAIHAIVLAVADPRRRDFQAV
jgi:ComF family protein